jgi:hypothetical protein
VVNFYINFIIINEGIFNISYLYMADKIQALMGGNSMIKGVLSNQTQMKMAQEMLHNPEIQKQIGGVISNPAVIKQASEVLSGLQQMNSVQAGGIRKYKRRFRKRRTKKKYRKKRTKRRRRRRTKKKRRKRRR